MRFQSIIEIDVDHQKFKASEDRYEAVQYAMKRAHPRLDLGTDATIKGIQYSTHVHPGVQSGSSETGAPQG